MRAGAGGLAIGYANGAQTRREGRAIDNAYQAMQTDGMFSDQAAQAQQQANKVIGLPVVPRKSTVSLPIFDRDGNQVNTGSTAQQAQKKPPRGRRWFKKSLWRTLRT
ncbi:MAG: hypothetical protein VB096_02460 [Pseudoflavonifractor sp.]|nr:hypothetical protein [Pseudoflavonifractor sp.]